MNAVFPLDENIPSASTATPATLTKEYSLKIDKVNYVILPNTNGSLIEIPQSRELWFLPETFDYAFQVKKSDFKLRNNNRKVIMPEDLLSQKIDKERGAIKKKFNQSKAEVDFHSNQMKVLFAKMKELEENPKAYFQRHPLEQESGLSPVANYILNGRPVDRSIGRVILPEEHQQDIAI